MTDRRSVHEAEGDGGGEGGRALLRGADCCIPGYLQRPDPDGQGLSIRTASSTRETSFQVTGTRLRRLLRAVEGHHHPRRLQRERPGGGEHGPRLPPRSWMCGGVAMPRRDPGERTCIYVVPRPARTVHSRRIIAFMKEKRDRRLQDPGASGGRGCHPPKSCRQDIEKGAARGHPEEDGRGLESSGKRFSGPPAGIAPRGAGYGRRSGAGVFPFF